MQITKLKTSLVLAALMCLGLLIGIYLTYTNKVSVGAPSINTSYAQTSTATTSISYATPGTATSTLVYDASEVNGTNQTNSGNNWSAESALLLLDVNASSTASVFNVKYEFSTDNLDWYSDYTSSATTTSNFNVTFATSTVGGVAAGAVKGINGTANRNTYAFSVPTPVRYVRAIISITGANGTFWGKIVPKKEVK